MDPETIKAVISATSAVVAILGAYFAQRARKQTRVDMFESQRDTLILVMAANDTRCENLALQTANARAELEFVHPDLNGCDLGSEAAEHVKNLNDLVPLTRILAGRAYSPDLLDQISYSEENLSGIRLMLRNEQVNAKMLSPEAFDIIFKHVEKYVARKQREA